MLISLIIVEMKGLLTFIRELRLEGMDKPLAIPNHLTNTPSIKT